MVKIYMDRREKIDRITFWFMLIVAAGYDALQILFGIIPFAGWILGGALGIIAKLHLWLWYKFRGVSFLERTAGRATVGVAGKLTARLVVFWGSFLFESIPIASILPLLAVSVLATNLIIRSEEKAVRSGILSPEEVAEFNRSLARGSLRGITPALSRSIARRAGRKRLARFREQQALEEMEEMAAAA